MAIIEHKEYAARIGQWQKVRDVVRGEDAVKERGTAYLPQLTSQRENAGEGYPDYILRAQFYGAARRTQQGLVGTVMRIPPQLDGVPDDMAETLRADAGIDSQSLHHVVADGLRELTTIGRMAVLVDKSRGDDPDAKPYILNIRAEDIVYWDVGEVDGFIVPNLIAIQETYDVPKDNDPIGNLTEEKPQLRILRFGVPDEPTIMEADGQFAGAPESGVYWQEIWRETDNRPGAKTASSLSRVEVIVPTKDGGRFWEEIPCDIVNATTGIAGPTEEPQMLDLANILLGWYRNSADLEYGRHLCGVPQPCVSGFQVPEGEKLIIGCGYAWVSEETGASAWYLEFTGAGLGHLADGMKEKEKLAAVIAGRMLETQPSNDAEAFGTVKLRRAGEKSALGMIADNASETYTRAIRRWMQWQSAAMDGPSGDAVAFELSTDFDAGIMEPGRMTELTTALQQGTMSWETFAYNLRRGEIYPPDVSDEEERERIQQGAPGRSREREMLILQADVRENRITLERYLERMNDLGVYADIDPQAELLALADQALENQNRMFQARASMILGSREGPEEPDEDPEEDDQPEVADDDEEEPEDERPDEDAEQ